MPSPEDIGAAARDAAAEYGQEQNAAGAAARQPEVDAANARAAALANQVVDLEAQLAVEANEPPPGYVVPNVGQLQKSIDVQDHIFLPVDHPATASLKLPPDGIRLLIGKDGGVTRRYSSKGTKGALFANRDFTRPVDVVDIQGGGHVEAGDGFRGDTFGLRANHILMRAFTCAYFLGGCYFKMGAHLTMDVCIGKVRPAPGSGSGTGGSRIMFGTGWIHGLDMWSGDDVLQAVPAGDADDPLFNVDDIRGLVYEDCIVKSFTGRPTDVGLQGDPGMATSIFDVLFKGIRGQGGGSAANVANHSPSTGVIDGVRWLDSIIDQSRAGLDMTPQDPMHGQPGELYLLRGDGCGEVRNVDPGGLTILNPRPKKPLVGIKGAVSALLAQPLSAVGPALQLTA